MIGTWEALRARLGVAELSPEDTARGKAALEDASALVTGFLQTVPDPVPEVVTTVVLRAAERGFRNPSGALSHTAGIYSESFDRTSATGGVYLTEQERTILKPYARYTALTSVPLVRPELAYRVFTVPVAGGGEDVPWFDPDES